MSSSKQLGMHACVLNVHIYRWIDKETEARHAMKRQQNRIATYIGDVKAHAEAIDDGATALQEAETNIVDAGMNFVRM